MGATIVYKFRPGNKSDYCRVDFTNNRFNRFCQNMLWIQYCNWVSSTLSEEEYYNPRYLNMQLWGPVAFILQQDSGGDTVKLTQGHKPENRLERSREIGQRIDQFWEAHKQSNRNSNSGSGSGNSSNSSDFSNNNKISNSNLNSNVVQLAAPTFKDKFREEFMAPIALIVKEFVYVWCKVAKDICIMLGWEGKDKGWKGGG